MAATSQYLTLGLAGETFGISIRNVREILDMRPISRLPHAPNFLLGMIESFSVFFAPTEWRDVIAFTFLIAVICVRPSGLFAGGEA